MVGVPKEIAREAQMLFWDADLASIDPEAHADYIIARVLSLGTLATVRALERHYGRDRLRRFFLEGGAARVDARTASLWRVLLRLTREECTSSSSRTFSDALWRG